MTPKPPAKPPAASVPPPLRGERGRDPGESSHAESIEEFLARQARLPARDVARKVHAREISDAEEARQNAAVVWLEKRPEIAPESREGSWWQTVRHRKLRLERERRCDEARKPRIAAHLRQVTPLLPSPEMTMARTRIQRWSINQIDPKRRDVAEQNLLEDKTLEAIAEEWGKPLGTVRSQSLRAKADLRAAVARLPEKDRGALRQLLLLLAALLGFVWTLFTRRGRGSERRLLACAACGAMALLVASDRGSDPPVLAFAEIEARADHVSCSWEPHFSTWAEREMEASGVTARLPSPVKPTSTAANARRRTSRSGSAAPGPKPPRDLLSRALADVDAGDLQTARAAAELYAETYGHDPYPAQRAHIAAETRSP